MSCSAFVTSFSKEFSIYYLRALMMVNKLLGLLKAIIIKNPFGLAEISLSLASCIHIGQIQIRNFNMIIQILSS